MSNNIEQRNVPKLTKACTNISNKSSTKMRAKNMARKYLTQHTSKDSLNNMRHIFTSPPPVNWFAETIKGNNLET